MDDREILDDIDRLVGQVRELQARAQEGDGLEADDALQLFALERERDRSWELLRQRRAKRAAGLDPAEAKLREPSTIEAYRQ